MTQPIITIFEEMPGRFSARSVYTLPETLQILYVIIESYIRGDERARMLAQNKNKIVNPATGTPVLGDIGKSNGN